MEAESYKHAWLLNQKKRHVHISDTDSEESFKASQQSKSSVPPKKPYVPKFLTIHSDPGESLPPCRGLWGTLHTGDDIDCNTCLLWEC